MEHRSGCAFCGKELGYIAESEEMKCIFCRNVFKSQAKCVDGHFICGACHSLSANDLIERFTVASLSRDPLDMAITLMKSPAVKMHGPEHHFLIPAVLLSAFSRMRLRRGKRGEDQKGPATGRESPRRLLRFLWRLRGRGRHRHICERHNGRHAFIPRGMEAVQPHNRALPRGHRRGGRTAVLQKKLLSCDPRGSQVRGRRVSREDERRSGRIEMPVSPPEQGMQEGQVPVLSRSERVTGCRSERLNEAPHARTYPHIRPELCSAAACRRPARPCVTTAISRHSAI